MSQQFQGEKRPASASLEGSNVAKPRKSLRKTHPVPVFKTKSSQLDSDSPDSPPNDHNTDQNYEPSSEQSASHTPNAQAVLGSHLSMAQNQKVLNKDPNGGACLVTGERVETQYAHIVSKATNIYIVNWLGIVWNLGRSLLNVHSSSNIMFLTPTQHTRFDQGVWCLVPALEDLKQVADHIKNKPGEAVHDAYPVQKIFKYRMLAFSELRSISLHHRSPAGTKEPAHYEEHPFPFNNLVLESHVPPHFIVVNSGRKIAQRIQLVRAINKNDNNKLQGFISSLAGRANLPKEVLIEMMFLYLSWTGNEPDIVDILERSAAADTTAFDDGGNHQTIMTKVYSEFSTREIARARAAFEDYKRSRSRQGATEASRKGLPSLDEDGDVLDDNTTLHTQGA